MKKHFVVSDRKNGKRMFITPKGRRSLDIKKARTFNSRDECHIISSELKLKLVKVQCVDKDFRPLDMNS
jgi:hypothetical protein